MGKYSYLIKNFGLLTIGQFTTKIITFLFTPLYTSILLTDELGTYEIYNTTIALMIPILTINVFEATLRFSLDTNQDNEALKIGTKYSIQGFLIFSVFVFINKRLGIYQLLNNYWYFLLLLFLLISFVELLSSFARGIDRVGVLALSGVISSSTTIISNIIFLAVIHLGLFGYFFSFVLGYFIQLLFLIYKIRPIERIKNAKTNKRLEKEMIKYSRPLIWNSLAWWINDISDRYLVSAIIGLAATGIYSSAYKVVAILNIIQTIFNRAWTISAVKEYDKEDDQGFFSNTYNIYNLSMVTMCSILIIIDYPISSFLLRKDFFEAWIYVPILLISVVFGAMAGYIGGVFSAVKKTRIYSISTGIGSLLNIVGNLIMLPRIGVIGAAISTLLSYVVIWIIRIVNVRKYITISINIKKHVFMYLLLICQCLFLLLIDNNLLKYSLLIFIFIIIIVINIHEIVGIIRLVNNKINYRRL